MTKFTQVRLEARPAKPTDDPSWLLTHDEPGTPQPGEISIEVEYISIDPAMRVWISLGNNYVDPVEVGGVMHAAGIGRVYQSNSPEFNVGDYVTGNTGVQTHSTRSAKLFQKITPGAWPLQTYIGGFGLAGMAAYFGLLHIGKPERGETVVISGAAGAVGSIAGQIAKIKGCRVIGIAGGESKCHYLKNTLNFDEAIDYQNTSVNYALKTLCPKQIDLFFDNVGGEVLEAGLNELNIGATVVLCGAIAQYNSTSHGIGPRNYMQLLMRRAKMEGFIATDYSEQFPSAVYDLASWHQSGKLHFQDHIVNGINAFPDALKMLFSGENTGKLMIKVSAPQH